MSTLPPDSAKPAAPVAGTDHDALPPGTRFGEFEILRVLGVGGFGIVYLAHDHSLEREVALKEYMPASLAARGLGPQITVRSSSFAETYAIGLRSFVNEARLLARFDHPSLVKVYRFWEDNATAYMVMPFLQGVTLRDTRRRMAHPPDEAWVRSVITPILSALELLHREGVYHRDIAPDNILLPPDGPPVLLDFGAARRVISDRTQSLTAILKPSYAPIEQYAEMTQLRQGPWTDLYALGAVIHYLLFGAPPAPATARAVQDDADVIENRIVPGVSPRFLEAVSWMLAIRPNQRPQSGEELRAVLDGTAVIPPRGRPGITIPPNLPAAAPTAPFQATRRVESGVEGTQVQTAHMPTFLPTAHVPAPGQPRPTTFSPTALMPTARSQASQFDTPLPSTVAPARAASTMPGELPQTRPTTVPPPLPAASGPYSQPLPAAAPAPAPMPTQAARSRPAPLAAMPDAMLPVTPAAPGQGQGASKAWLAVAGAGVVVVIAAAAAWQFAGKRGDGVDASAAAASAVSSTAAASVPALPSVAATTSPTATTAAAAATTAATLPTTPATAMTATVPNPSTLPAVDSGASPTRPAIAATGTDRPVLPDDAKPVPSRTPRPATTARVETPPDSGRLPVSERNAVAGERGGPVEASAGGTRPRPLGRPVPRVGEGDPATAGPSTSPRPFENANGPRGNPYGTPPVVNYGSGTTAAGNPVERSRPLGMPAQREPALAGRPVPQPAEIGAPTSAREACGRRVFIALAVCMDDRCEEPRFRNTAECIGILERKHTREGR